MLQLLREFLFFEWLSFNFTLLCVHFIIDTPFILVVTVVSMTSVGAAISYYTLPIFISRRTKQC